MTTRIIKWVLAASFVWSGSAAYAQTTRDKANNTDNLNLGSSWVGGVAPGAGEVARWNSTVTGPNAVLLGADRSYRGITIVNPAGTVAIGGGHTLSTDMLGLNLSAATADLIITNGTLTLKDYASPVWNVASGRTLTVSPAAFARGSQATLGLPGAGTVASAALANDATGIVGPWARTGTGTATRYATVSGGNVVGSTGTAAADASEVTDTTGTVNYDVAAAGTVGAGAAFRTLRYTGAAGTVAGAFAADGLMNAGAGTLTLSGNVTVGPTRELVLTSPDSTRALTFSGAIGDDAGGASDVTVTGGGLVNLFGASGYSGTTVVGMGVLVAYHSNALGSASGPTLVYSTGRTTDGGQFALAGGVTVAEPITLVGPGDGASGSYTRTLDAWSGTNTLSGTLTLTGTSGYRIGVSGANAVLNVGLIRRSTTGGGNLIVDPGAGRVLNISEAIDNNNGDLICHGGGGSGLTVLMASSNDLGYVRVQNDSSLKVTAPQALSANRYLMIGQGSGNTATGVGNDRGVFYLDAANLAVNELIGYANGGSNASATHTRRVTSATSGSKTLTVGYNGGTGSFDGVIEDGSGGGTTTLVKAGGGTQTLTGTRDNTYTGLTVVNGGILALNKTAGTNAVPGDLVIGAGTLSHSQNHQIADAATVTMTNGAAKWLLNGKAETIADLDMQNAGATANAGFVSGGAGKLTVTGTLTHSGGDITLNSSGAGNVAWIDANAVVNLGGTWTFGVIDGTQVLYVGAGVSRWATARRSTSTPARPRRTRSASAATW